MARKNQKLINYHTSSKIAMPSGSDVEYGEIVVRHNEEAPELLIKVGDDSFGVFQASGAVKTAIDTVKEALDGEIRALDESLSGHVANFDKFQSDAKKTYATKDELKSTSGSIISTYTKAIADAKTDVYNSATTFATSAVTAAKNELSSTISGVTSDLKVLSGVVKSISTNIGDNYVTSGTLKTTVETLESKISSAKTEAIGTASGYTDAQIKLAKEYSDGKLSAATESLKQTITGVDNKVSTLSGNVHTTIANVQTALTKTINDKVATAYRYKGSCTYAQLTGKTAEFTGEVWNVTDANGDFPAGTNYAWNGTEWDALGGSIDLSPYAKTEDVNKKIETINQTNENLQSAIDNVSAATKTLVGEVSAATKSTYATKTALQTAQNNITTAYTKAITDAKAEVYTSATTFANNAVTAATATLNQSIKDVDGRVTDLSGVTKTVKATADSAVQAATVNSNAKVTKNGTSLDFDFSGLIIDCGDFR